MKCLAVHAKWLLDQAWRATYISVTAPYAAVMVGDVGSSIIAHDGAMLPLAQSSIFSLRPQNETQPGGTNGPLLSFN